MGGMPMDATDAVRPRHETQSDHLAPTPNLLRGKGKGRSVTPNESDVLIFNMGISVILKISAFDTTAGSL